LEDYIGDYDAENRLYGWKIKIMTDEFLTSDELGMIRADIKSVLQDTDMSVAMIYRRLVSQTFNPSTGTNTPVWVEIPMTGFRTEFTLHSIAVSNGMIKVGDFQFLIDPALLQAMPKPDDRVLELITKAGRVALTSGSSTVQGMDNAKFVIEGVQGGDLLRIGNTDRVVKSITDDDTLILSANYTGSSVLATDYMILRQYEVANHTRAALDTAIRLQLRRAGG